MRNPLVTIGRDDLMWLAGYLEGEGCFSICGERGNPRRYPQILLGSTDLDVVERTKALLGSVGVIGVRRRMLPGHKQAYTISLHGNAAVAWMYALFPFMGTRRKARIAEVIRIWASGPKPRRRGVALCHPGREHGARNLCKSCVSAFYQREQRRKLRELLAAATTQGLAS